MVGGARGVWLVYKRVNGATVQRATHLPKQGAAIHAHLDDVTDRIIASVIHNDSSGAAEVAASAALCPAVAIGE